MTLVDGTSIFSSWITDRPGGFADADLERIRAIEPVLTVVTAAALGTATAGTLLATYLGADAASRVIGGDVERGKVEMIHAVIWYSDLAGFTRLTDQVAGAGMLQLFTGHAEILGLLNDHAEILVDAIEGEGGQVLKFMGDGILAIFRAATEADACEAALAAWIDAEARCARLARRRIGETHPYLALHAGDVLYGNIGGRARLDFTVLGPAVNEASRIAALCRQLDRNADHVRGLRRALPSASPRRAAGPRSLRPARRGTAADAVRAGAAGRRGTLLARLRTRARVCTAPSSGAPS